jgi:hypothetical protein
MLTWLLALSCAVGLVPQAGAIHGRVVDASTGDPLPGVVIVLQGTGREAVSGADGSFAFDGVPAGRQSLFVSLVGYALARPQVDVPGGGVTDIEVPLAPGTGAYTETVNVVSDPVRGAAPLVPSAQVLTSGEILELRGVLTDDPLRAVQALPAAATSDDFRSEFSVRGSDFAHVGLSVDGIPIAWPVHSIPDREAEGSISMVNGSVLDSVTLLAGTYPQDRPGRTGAWVDLTVREGSRAAMGVRGSLSATAASVVVEGPLGRGPRGSWLLSARQSYVQWLLDRLDHDTGQTAFGFTDVQSKFVFDASRRHQLQLTLMGGLADLDDEQERPNETSIGAAEASSGLAALAWRWTASPALILTQRAAVGANDFRSDGTLGAVLADGYAARLAYRATADVTFRPGVAAQVGAYLQRHRADETFTRFPQPRELGLPPLIERVVGAARLATVHGRVTWAAERWSLDAGVMGERSTLADGAAWSPWLLVRVPVAGALVARAGFDLTRQSPDLEHALGTFRAAEPAPERARQVEIALEQQLPGALRWQVTAYDRRERDLYRLQDAEPRLAAGEIVLPSSDPYWANALRGSSRGVELTLQRRAASGLSGWIGYAYGRTSYTDVVRAEAFPGDHDRRHTFSAFALYRLTPRTSVSATLRGASNIPIAGYFRWIDGRLHLADERNRARLPRYARLDLRATHAFNFDRRRLTLFAEILNVTGRENLAADYPWVHADGRVSNATHSLFPFLPSAGFMVDF